MKLVLFIMSFFVFSFFIKAQGEIKTYGNKSYYDSEYNPVDDLSNAFYYSKKIGKDTNSHLNYYYSSNDNLHAEISIKGKNSGIKHGDSKWYDENGNLTHTIKYENNIEIYKEFFNLKGKTTSKEYYSKEGNPLRTLFYYSNGKVNAEVTYLESLKDFKTVYYDKNGNIIGKMTDVDSKRSGVLYEFDEFDNVISKEEYYPNGLAKYSEWYSDGILCSKNLYSENGEITKTTWYYSDAKVKMEYKYTSSDSYNATIYNIKGAIIGTYKQIQKEEYEEPQYIGKVISFSKEGCGDVITQKDEYREDRTIILSEFYSENGFTYQKTEYDKNGTIVKDVAFYINGKIKYETNYIKPNYDITIFYDKLGKEIGKMTNKDDKTYGVLYKFNDSDPSLRDVIVSRTEFSKNGTYLLEQEVEEFEGNYYIIKETKYHPQTQQVISTNSFSTYENKITF